MISPKKIDANDRAAAVGPDGLAQELESLAAAAAPVTVAAEKPAAAPARKKDDPGDNGNGAEKPDKERRHRPQFQRLAGLYLKESLLGSPGPTLRMKYFQGAFYRYTGRQYVSLNGEDVQNSVGAFLQKIEETAEHVSRTLVENVLANVRFFASLPADTPFPSWLSAEGNSRPARDCIAAENGILKFEKTLEGCEVTLLPHSLDFFSANCLPYKFDPDADCPIFKGFFAEVIPDAGMRGLLQEFMGLLLLPDTTFEKFLLLVGSGANGKSVFLDVLRAMLGDANCSFVPMSQFAAEKTWGLIPIIGKLANLDYDADEVSNIEEGRFKAFTGGGMLSLDRKFGQPVDHLPTARMVVATNSPPIFRDRSDAIWRRLLYIPFSVKIEEEKQNPDFKLPGFWREKGELPGILNFAVEGLKRLYERRRFVEPEAMLAAKREYFLDIRPEARFLSEKYEFTGDPADCISSRILFENYHDFLKENGHGKGLTLSHFGRQIQKFFPRAENVRMNYDGTGRERCWIGIRKIVEPSEEPAAAGIGYGEGATNGW